ncbi:hypothetical protein Pint_14163 [Pistacia integerrima]|uniref:Uncharacterized protein n=1 Tax=Pistacia integerrima TaxID=434235 RepID=A0ACC0Y7B2_9ROSI|nr:hypothetical protein Pint_14163 [Pistacia integerrima]
MAASLQNPNSESQIPADLLTARTIEIHASILKLESLKPSKQVNSLFTNLVKLFIANLEYTILSENGLVQPKKVAFVGSGPMPLTSLIMASHHMKSTHFDNFDIDGKANHMARKIVSDTEFEKRMKFHTCDILEVKKKLGEYDCIFLAALFGMSKE